MNDIKISVVMPIYNCEDYLDDSITSVLNQKYDNWELIIINDGSTDNSEKIIKKYLEKDKRIILINQKNSGPSVARNEGIKVASGEYIVFLDGDDWLDQNLFKYINKVAKTKKVDAFVGTFNTKLETKDAYPLQSEVINKKYVNNKTCEEVLHYFYRLRLVLTVWRFVVRKEVFDKNKVLFKPDIVHEDEEFMPILLTKCNSFHLVPFPFYNYRIRSNSITTSKTLYNFECYIVAAQSLLNYSKTEENEEKKLFLMRYAYNDLYMAHWGVKTFSKPIKKIKRRKAVKMDNRNKNSVKLLGIKK